MTSFQDDSRAKSRWSSQGFSVVEMLIVFTVVAVAILPLARIQFGSREQINTAAREVRALQIAESEIERVKMQGFDAAIGDTMTVDQYSFVTSVAPDPTNPFLQDIQTTVTWSQGGEVRSIVLAGKQAARR